MTSNHLPYPDAASHLDDHIDRLLARLDDPAADPEASEPAAQLAAREAATPGLLPLRALALRAGLHWHALAVLLIAAAPALDARLAERVRERTLGKLPTADEIVGMVAGSRAEEPLVRAALAADAPLCAMGLVEIAEGAVRVDERVIGFLRGDAAMDRRLHGIAAIHAEVPRASGAAAAEIAVALGAGAPVVVEGPHRAGKTTAAIAAVAGGGGRALVVDLEVLVDGDARGAMLARARREALLSGARLVLRAPAWDEAWPLALRRALIAAVQAGAILTIPDGSAPCRSLVGPRRVRIEMPSTAAQREIWRAALDGRADGAAIDEVVARYPLPPGEILLAAAAARVATSGTAPTASELRAAARARLAHRLGDTAELISTTLSWSDLVLRDDVAARVRELIATVRFGEHVLERWGFGAKLPYGRSIGALFSGPPGTGKTMVATLIGKELGLEVFRVDLSRVVSKYIGETEKNLARVFDEARHANAIILFDEADSLFAKRTNVSSSTDRYANLEVGYLLQKLEAHEGIVILTTNAANAIDEAFIRRLRFRVEFTAPDEHERAALWRAMVPPAAPLAADVDFEELGRRFRMTGGHIKNAVVRAAYLAAAEGMPALSREVLGRAATLEWTETGHLPTELLERPRAATAAPAGLPLRLALRPAGSLEHAPEHAAPLAPERAPRATPLPDGLTARGVYEPAEGPPPFAQKSSAHASLPARLERELGELLTGGPRAGETIDGAYRRVESQLGAAFARLSAAESRGLHHRLSAARADDGLAGQFARLSVERRQRLLAFLADAPRREAARPRTHRIAS